MDAATFRAFVKTAMALQADDDTPGDYVMVRAALGVKFPDLMKTANPYLELAGLGTLAAPATAELAGKHVSDRTKQVAEVGGLGMLAAPYAHQIAARKNKAYAASRLGQRLSHAFGH